MNKLITREDIEIVQQKWGTNIVQIGVAFQKNEDFRIKTKNLVEKFYGYNEGTVLFKPTKACKKQFRLTFESAVSYFIGGNPKFPEDKGFALQPWIKVRFENSGFIFKDHYAIAMGNYYFSDDLGHEAKVEFTFGYFRTDDGQIKIHLHHSSLPYKKS